MKNAAKRIFSCKNRSRYSRKRATFCRNFANRRSLTSLGRQRASVGKIGLQRTCATSAAKQLGVCVVLLACIQVTLSNLAYPETYRMPRYVTLFLVTFTIFSNITHSITWNFFEIPGVLCTRRSPRCRGEAERFGSEGSEANYRRSNGLCTS